MTDKTLLKTVELDCAEDDCKYYKDFYGCSCPTPPLIHVGSSRDDTFSWCETCDPREKVDE